MLGRKDWSSLIDSPQYNGPLLYPNSEENVYNWHDEGNTELASRLVNAYGDGNFWTGGMAVSDYVDTDLGNGDFNHQLAVFSRDGDGNGGEKDRQQAGPSCCLSCRASAMHRFPSRRRGRS